MNRINSRKKPAPGMGSSIQASRFTGLPAFWVLLAAFAFAPASFAQRTQLKPGMNLFSTQQDVELGRKTSQQAENQLPMLNNARIDGYLDRLGKKLAAKAPGEKYPYQFKGVNDASINAFALPGGFLYINRGTIEAADNEAQLAGVISHEIGHVALRHGTNQASKAQITEMPLAILGGIMGNSNSIAALVTKLGSSFAMGSILLKYSRDAERQADIMGTQILYDNNYDPRAMAQFFEKLETKGGGSDFFSDHPKPENRINNINTEIEKMGGRQANYVNDSAEFRQIKAYVHSLPPAPKAATQTTGQPGGSAGARPPAPSTVLQDYQNGPVSLRYPNNWRSYGQENAFTLAPDGGIVGSNENSALAYGIMMAHYEPSTANNAQPTLQGATDQLVNGLQKANPSMRITKGSAQIRVAGENALSLMLNNTSPVGGNETDWLVTVLRSGQLVYFVFVAPEQEFGDYQRAFESTLSSIRFSSR
jgi:beta-barrel assembly-enhancing protease